MRSEYVTTAQMAVAREAVAYVLTLNLEPKASMARAGRPFLIGRAAPKVPFAQRLRNPLMDMTITTQLTESAGGTLVTLRIVVDDGPENKAASVTVDGKPPEEWLRHIERLAVIAQQRGLADRELQ